MYKRIFIIIITILLSSSVFAKTSIDQAITNAAVDITDKCNAKSILMIDDFESPTPAMTLYIREQLADTIFAEDGLIQIVTREHMDKIEKELKFQNSGVVSEKTILSVAERLGARFAIFGKLEEFNSGFILRVRMLDVKTGAYLFRKTYEFGYSQKTAQLLGNASSYKKVAVGGIGEINKNSIEFVAPAAGLSFDFSLWRKFSIGAKVLLSYDYHEKQNQILTIETLGTLRYYIVSFSGEPISGIYLEAQFGASSLLVDSKLKTVFNAGGAAGYRFTLGSFYVEPEIRFGYPYMCGAGLAAGMRF